MRVISLCVRRYIHVCVCMWSFTR